MKVVNASDIYELGRQMAELQAMIEQHGSLEALKQIQTVCEENSSASCRHDLALLFIADIARTAIAKKDSKA